MEVSLVEKFSSVKISPHKITLLLTLHKLAMHFCKQYEGRLLYDTLVCIPYRWLRIKVRSIRFIYISRSLQSWSERGVEGAHWSHSLFSSTLLIREITGEAERWISQKVRFDMADRSVINFFTHHHTIVESHNDLFRKTEEWMEKGKRRNTYPTALGMNDPFNTREKRYETERKEVRSVGNGKDWFGTEGEAQSLNY